MNKAWFALIIASVALSGCTEPTAEEDPVVDDFRDEYEGQQGTDSGADPEPAETEPETEEDETEQAVLHPSLAAGAEQVNAGGVVTFTIDAAATDADGNPMEAINITWALFSEDESLGLQESGEGVPATVNFTLETVGVHTFIAGVNADNADEAFANVTVEVLPANVEPEPVQETWYLHYPPGCGDRYMSLVSKEADQSGCGSLLYPANIVAGPAGMATWSGFPSVDSTAGHDAGAPLAYSINGHFGAGVAVLVEWELYASGVLVASGSDTTTTPMVPFAVYGDVSGTSTLDSAIAPGSDLLFQYYLYGAPYWEGPSSESTVILG